MFKAPEGVSGGRLGTPQTDTFSAGGIAYEAMEGEGFHFRDPKGMGAKFMSQVERVMRAYGDSEDDEGVYRKSGEEDPEEDPEENPQENPEENPEEKPEKNPSVRRVNEHGEETPEGKHLKKDPMFTSARTQLTEFMNSLMHPDPKRRLRRRSARTPVLARPASGEDDIKNFIRRPGTVPSGKDKDAKKSATS